MAAKWGVFFCNCRQTLAVDSLQLNVPTPYVYCASHPEIDVQAFAGLAKRAQLTHVLISCCASPTLFEETLHAADYDVPTIHVVNLKESCFWSHSDSAQAHAKATRLLRAAMQTAAAQSPAAYNPLSAGGRVLIACDPAFGQQLAVRLGDVAQPLFVVPPEAPAVHTMPSWRVYRGYVREVKGRLGDFHVTVEEGAAGGASRRELQADQVVLVSPSRRSPIKARTGCYVLDVPEADTLAHMADSIRHLIGDFFKTVHLSYHTDVCAGGSAAQEACGVCIPACPYDAIRRDSQNPLRLRVDHMACEGCGACVSACPTSALRFTEPSPHELYTRLAALLAPLPGTKHEAPQVVLFHCGEQGRRVLAEAGQRPLPYPASVLPVEVPCLRYVSAANMLAAFRLGAAGVGLLGCETCQHGERELLYQQLDFCQLTLEVFALGTARLRLVTAQEGTEVEAITALSRFAETLEASPLHWDGQPVRQVGSREVIAEALAAFMEQLGREPGRRVVQAPQPFAFADVQEAGCTLCRSCVNVCPVHAFRLDAGTSSLQFKHVACVACGLCEAVCPEHVITLRREIVFERAALAYQTVVQDDMVACVQCGQPYVNKKALQAVESKLLSLPSLLDTFDGQRRALLRMCPTCRAVAAMLEVDKGWEP